MINNPIGSHYVRGWDEDLKQLKHYRWMRNQIVHEPNYSEENMCEFGDAEWLNEFHSRICHKTIRWHSIARHAILRLRKNQGKHNQPNQQIIHTQNIKRKHQDLQAV